MGMKQILLMIAVVAFYEGINDFLITEISRTHVEQLDPRPDLFKCLILKEGLQVIIPEQNLPDGKPWPRPFTSVS